MYSEYTPCIHCKKYLLKISPWAHKTSCVAAPSSQSDGKDNFVRNLVRQGKSMLSSALFTLDETSLVKLFERMRHDEVTDVAMSDPLIRRYASLRMESLGADEDQKINDVHRVSQGTRTLACLVIEAKKLDEQQLINMNSLIRPENFDLVVKPALTMALRKDNQVTSLGQRIGHALSHVIAMKIGLALRRNDKTKQTEAEAFEKLFGSEWNFRVNSSCTKRRNNIKRKKVKTIPLTEDLKTLREHITTKIGENINALKENPKPEYWTSLAKYTMSRLILFNMRRQAEVKDLMVSDFVDRPNWALDQAGEFEMALSTTDRLCAKRMDMLIAAGKSRKNVDAYVLLPPDAKLAVEMLIKYRSQVGVPLTNPYIFARLTADTPLSGNQELRNAADSCPGLEHPERICSNALRKYIATVSQILDMNEKEVEMLATHLGHDVRTHKENYRLAHSTRELTAVAQLLLTVERGDVNRWKGKTLCDTEIEEVLEDEKEDLDQNQKRDTSYENKDQKCQGYAEATHTALWDPPNEATQGLDPGGDSGSEGGDVRATVAQLGGQSTSVITEGALHPPGASTGHRVSTDKMYRK